MAWWRWVREGLCPHHDLLRDRVVRADGRVVRVLRCQQCWRVRDLPFTDEALRQPPDPHFRRVRSPSP